MAYNPTQWIDHLTEHPNRWTMVPNADGTVTLTPAFGEVVQAGTPISAANMNKIEQGIVGATDAVNTHEERTDNPHEVTAEQTGAVPYPGSYVEPVEDLDSVRDTGWYAYGGSTLNRPDLEIDDFGNAGMGLVDRGSENRLTQTAYGQAGLNTARVANRTHGSGGWGPWRADWNNDNNPSSTGSSGYQKLASGIIFQWGSHTVSSGVSHAIVFPITFPNYCSIVQTTVETSDPSITSSVEIQTATYAEIYHSSVQTEVIYWFAVGY